MSIITISMFLIFYRLSENFNNNLSIEIYNHIYTLKTSVLLLHVNHDSNFLGIWSVYF